MSGRRVISQATRNAIMRLLPWSRGNNTIWCFLRSCLVHQRHNSTCTPPRTCLGATRRIKVSRSFSAASRIRSIASVSWIFLSGVFGSRIGPVGFTALDLPVARRVVERVAVFVVDVFSVTFTYLSGFDHVPSSFVSGNPFGHLFWFLLIFSLSSFFSLSCSRHYTPLQKTRLDSWFS